MMAVRCGWSLGGNDNRVLVCGRGLGHGGSHGSWVESAAAVTELTEARQLNCRYRDALQLIRERPDPWCSDYAMCDHEGCKASHRAFEIARKALDVESSF